MLIAEEKARTFIITENKKNDILRTLLHILYHRIPWIWWRIWNVITHTNRNGCSHHWFSSAEFTDIAVNTDDTWSYWHQLCYLLLQVQPYIMLSGTGMSVLGSVPVHTIALVLPSLIMMIVISKMFLKYMNTLSHSLSFRGLVPCSGRYKLVSANFIIM